MKNSLATVAVISASLLVGSNLIAQSRSAQRRQVEMAGTGHMDLGTTLVDLDRVSQATQSDIANMHVETWKSGWKTGFLKDGEHKDQAQQAAKSLQRNLANALPGLIHEVQSSRGSVSTTFKLYDDVSLVCEAVDSLITASEAAGKKGDAAPLVDDFSAFARVRRSLSNYIQQSSAVLDSRSRTSYAAVSAPSSQAVAPQRAAVAQKAAPAAPQVVMDQGVKKIIVDDTAPEKAAPPAAKKKPATTLTNLE